MVAFSAVKAGDVLYESRHDTWRSWGNWKVKVISVDSEKQTAVVS